MNPRIDIYLSRLKHNVETIVKRCNEVNIDVAGVTKAFCAIPEIAQSFIDGGVSYLADSRMENLKKLKDLPIPKMLLRLPMISQIEEVVQYADISLNSEIDTIILLNESSKKLNKIHNVILMVDLGDLREGIMDGKELKGMLDRTKDLSYINILGIGTNLTCYGGVIPDKDNLDRLVKYGELIEERLNRPLKIISGGNSSSIYMLEKKGIPSKVNNLRLGESLLFGRECAYGNTIPDTFQDAFQLVAEIIEIKEKPSIPIGRIGMDAFGNKPKFVDKGLRKRAILAIGRQDFTGHSMKPLEEKVEILGASSDHLIIDITDSDYYYKVGDEMSFNLTYGALLALMTSEYVYKNIIE